MFDTIPIRPGRRRYLTTPGPFSHLLVLSGRLLAIWTRPRCTYLSGLIGVDYHQTELNTCNGRQITPRWRSHCQACTVAVAKQTMSVIALDETMSAPFKYLSRAARQDPGDPGPRFPCSFLYIPATSQLSCCS